MISFSVKQIISRHQSTDSPLWHDKQLFFIDPPGHKLCSYHADKSVVCATIGRAFLSFAVPVLWSPDEFVGGYDNKLLLVTWNSHTTDLNPKLEFSKNTKQFKNIEVQIQEDRMSYGTIDPTGRLWFETMNVRGPKFGSVWSFSPTIPPYLTQHMNQGENNLNDGIVWYLPYEQPARIYNVDALRNRIVSYNCDLERDDIIQFVGVIFDPEKCHEHGINRMRVRIGHMAIAERGSLWVPLIGSSGVIEIDPHGEKVLRFIRIPARRVIACTFGGPNGNILYVTTMGYGPRETRPHNDQGGAIFSVKNLGESAWAYPSRQFAMERIPFYWRHLDTL